MKTIPLSFVTFIFLAAVVSAQVSPGPIPIGSIDSNAIAMLSTTLGTWQPGHRDAGSTEWRRIQLETNVATGTIELQTNHYTEVANNVNFRNASGEWEASEDRIELLSTNVGGAAALKGPTKVYFPSTLGGSEGPLTIVGVSNTVLKIRPIGLYYFDAQSGKSVLLASAQQAEGELVGANQVIYKSVFNGCDLRVTYTKGAIESDLIMRVGLKPPESFGLSNAYTRLELWHAVDGPVPVQTPTVLDSVTDPTLRATMAEPDYVDEALNFSDLCLPQGRAFSWNGLDSQTSPDVPVQVHLPMPGVNAGDVVVAKQWGQIGGQSALGESVRWTEIEQYLASLPLMGKASDDPSPVQEARLGRPAPGERHAAGAANKPMKVVWGGYKAKGFVWDYTIVSGSQTPFTFSNQTYFISGIATFSSTVTFNAGCCLKYADGAYLYIYGSVVCNGNSSSKSVLTSMHDNAYGQQIDGSTGYPTYCASPAVWLFNNGSAQTLSWMKIRWAKTGVRSSINGAYNNSFLYSSLEWCQTGLCIDNGTVALLSGDVICSVGTTFGGAGTYTGYVVDECTGYVEGNGLPYSWEIGYFGYTGVTNNDPDGDGLSNLQEYSCGTNPQVSDRPTIQPQNPLFVRGGSLTFTANVAGTQPQSYQWSFNGANILGATTSTYTIANVQLDSCGYYVVSADYSNVWLSSTSTFLSVAAATNGVPVPPNIVSWWQAEGNANDSVGTNNGQWAGSASYTNGEVGQAFRFNGSSCVQVTNSASLRLTNAFSIEFWYKDTGSPGWAGLVANRDGYSGACNFGINVLSTYGMLAYYHETNGADFQIATVMPPPTNNVFHHIAAVYQQINPSQVRINVYVDGSVGTTFTGQGNLANTLNSAPVTIGSSYLNGEPLTGLVDEVGIYSRALYPYEIQAIYNTGSAGKYSPPAPPAITSGPQSVTVTQGANATFTVGVTGATPYSYQWTFNGSAISGANSTSYTVTNALSGNVGNYAVVVANSGGSMLSTNASLSPELLT